MPKVKISEYSATANSNTDVASINIDEGCAPSGINNAIRAVMGHLKDFQQGTYGDPFNGPVNGTVGATTPSTGAFTTLSATGNVTLGDASTDTLNVGNGGLIKDASGNVGVGISPSSNAGLSTLNIANYNRTFSALTMGSNANSAGYIGYNMGNTSTSNTWKYISADTGSALYFAGNEYRFMQFASGSAGATTSGNQAMTLDASSRLGIGTTSPTARLSVIAASANSTAATIGGIEYGGSKRGLTIKTFNSAGGDDCGVEFNAADGFAGYGAFKFTANTTTLATIDSSGNLLVGTSSQTPGYGNTNTGQQLGGSSVSTFSRSATDFVIVCNQNTVDGSTYYQMQFRVSDVSKGSITSSSAGTAYNTSSDYRLKNTIAPMTGALAKVALLKPCTYKWNADGSDGEGFIAHELAEVVPQCVTGEKDAINEDGSIKSQGIDTSFLIATLTAAIQEQQALITQLTARITALEGA